MRNTPLDEKHPYLMALAERVRQLRGRRGLTRKAAAARAQVSERHWANLEAGTGNASILVLLQVAKALQCSLVSLLEEAPAAGSLRRQHIALIGLRGAGKSTLGQRLAKELGYVFVELSRVIEQLASCSISEIHGLYGPQAYRRYERRALEELGAASPCGAGHPWGLGVRGSHFQFAAGAMLHHVVASHARGSYGPRHGPG